MGKYLFDELPEEQRERVLNNYIEREKIEYKQYLEKNPESLYPAFLAELNDMGFEVEIMHQVSSFLPEYKDCILPLAIKYYRKAKEIKKIREAWRFMGFFHYYGFEEVVPELLEDYQNPELESIWWDIGDTLYAIRSKKYIDEYLKIITDREKSRSRLMVVLLVGKLRPEKAIPLLIELLDDEDAELHALEALANYKRTEFIPIFERYISSKRAVLRNTAKSAIARIKKAQEKERLKAEKKNKA